ncbi:MAG: response regulator transcription factor [Lachnospiraceae bacterium]|nr:response regulator transcription factor [Lachnoclostridium sp.]MDD7521567.1 response regulator transcription factor [Lachnoclostridium sp.]MDY2599080.1 response regulator transcription factor [Lachnospiraceae bacterium]
MLIYIVEDDNNIQEIEEYALKSSGFEVKCFDKAISFQKEIKNELPDLILLDIMLPGEDGLSVLGKLRSNSRTKHLPVIMVTAKVSEIDTVKGLDLGADDYITKPFGVMELISRVKALLRRIRSDEESVLSYKNLEIDVVRHVCLVNGVQIELTYKEYELLKLFMSNIGIVMSRDSIMNSVWGFDYVGESRTIDMHIKTLRKKLGDAGVYIITVRNVGYKLE